MLSTINPYGLGNAYKTPEATLNVESKITQEQVASQATQEAQELPNLSQNVLEIRKFTDGIKVQMKW